MLIWAIIWFILKEGGLLQGWKNHSAAPPWATFYYCPRLKRCFCSLSAIRVSPREDGWLKITWCGHLYVVIYCSDNLKWLRFLLLLLSFMSLVTTCGRHGSVIKCVGVTRCRECEECLMAGHLTSRTHSPLTRDHSFWHPITAERPPGSPSPGESCVLIPQVPHCLWVKSQNTDFGFEQSRSIFHR